MSFNVQGMNPGIIMPKDIERQTNMKLEQAAKNAENIDAKVISKHIQTSRQIMEQSVAPYRGAVIDFTT